MEDSVMQYCYAFIHPLRNWIVEKTGVGHKPVVENKKQDSLGAGEMVLLPIAVFVTAIVITASL
jgi:hypothetical protein